MGESKDGEAERKNDIVTLRHAHLEKSLFWEVEVKCIVGRMMRSSSSRACSLCCVDARLPGKFRCSRGKYRRGE